MVKIFNGKINKKREWRKRGMFVPLGILQIDLKNFEVRDINQEK